MLLIAAVWLMPRRTERIVPVDGTASWDARHAPPRRQIVWQPASEIDSLIADDGQAEGVLKPSVYLYVLVVTPSRFINLPVVWLAWHTNS